MPGPNDYHAIVVMDEATGKPAKTDNGQPIILIEPGLGADEPSESQRANAQRVSLDRITAMHKDLEAKGQALTTAQRTQALKEKELEERERQLEARQKAFDRMLAKADSDLAGLGSADGGEGEQGSDEG